MSFPSTLPEGITFKKMFFMVKCICVRGSLLFLFPIDLVGEPAVNRQPGFRRALVEQTHILCNISACFSPRKLVNNFCNIGWHYLKVSWKSEHVCNIAKK